MQTIVTLTMNPAIDTSTFVKQVIPNCKLRCNAPRHDAGGGGINVARAVKSLGGDALAVYPAGGPTGKLLYSLLEREGVRQLVLPTDEWTREDWYVLDESTAQQYRFIMPGAELHQSDWQTCLDKIANLPEKPTYLVASGSLPPGVPDDFFARVARLAKKMGTKFVLDTRGVPLQLALKEGVYLVKPNLKELCELSGQELAEEPEQSKAVQNIVRKGQAEVVVLSLGPGGAIYATSDGCELLRAPTVRVRSRAGAGDSMLGGMVLALTRGMALRAAVLYGIAAGSAATLHAGTQLCGKEDTDRIFHRSR